MTTGIVRSLHILFPITFRMRGLTDIVLEFIVDTGFTGAITLPPAAVSAMRLPFLYKILAQLADGSYVEVAIHSANILWNGVEVEIRVLSTGERPLLGTALLDGCELLAQFREEGMVTIADL